MKDRIASILIAALFSVFCMAGGSFAHTHDKAGLTAAQKAIVPISAFTASGDLQKLATALNQGLDAGLTVNEIKEIIVHLYAYVGFPRSLNGLNTFMTVLDKRAREGIKDKVGKDAGPMPAGKTSLEIGTKNQTFLIGRPASGKYIAFAPAIDYFLKAHLFGDIFGRDVLDFKTREIVTLSALASVNGLTPQLRGHLRASMNVGLSEAQIRDLISVIGSKVGKKQAETASGLLDQVLGKKKGKASGSGNAKAKAAKVIVLPHKTLPARKGDAKHFTGEVDIDTLFNAPAPSNSRGGRVAFKPGARTAWHRHTKGQLLIITSGAGLVQGWGEPVQEVRKGDVVWFPPRVKHWHGAAPDSAMSHIAIVEPLNGKSTEWLELVSDEQYGK